MLLNCGEISCEQLRRISVVLAAGEPPGVAWLVPLLQRFAGTVLIARELSEFERLLRRTGDCGVVLSDPKLEGGGWRDVLRFTQSIPVPPSFVLAAKEANGQTWAELYAGGGFDLMCAPWSDVTVQRVVGSAARRWLRAKEIADARSSSRSFRNLSAGQ